MTTDSKHLQTEICSWTWQTFSRCSGGGELNTLKHIVMMLDMLITIMKESADSSTFSPRRTLQFWSPPAGLDRPDQYSSLFYEPFSETHKTKQVYFKHVPNTQMYRTQNVKKSHNFSLKITGLFSLKFLVYDFLYFY